MMTRMKTAAFRTDHPAGLLIAESEDSMEGWVWLDEGSELVPAPVGSLFTRDPHSWESAAADLEFPERVRLAIEASRPPMARDSDSR
jgi:hypothetical protein